MQIIDCDASFGFRVNSPCSTSAGDLVRLEKAQGVSYVMAYSIKARAYDAREGNDDTLKAAGEYDELLPVACVDPRAQNHLEDEIARVAGLGFVAVRVFPELQGWSPDSVLFTRIARACNEHGMPLLISVKAFGTASSVVRRAEETTNPIVLLAPNYAMLSEALSAAAVRLNTLVSTSQFITPGSVEIAVEAIGARNLVFGAMCPDMCIRPPVNMILGANIADSDKSAILSGNIKRLINSQAARLNRTLSEVVDDKVYATRRFSRSIIDVHGHTGPWPFPMVDADGACIVDLMRRRGIAATMLSSTKAIVNDFVEGNAELAHDVQTCDNLYGYVTVNPNYPEKSLEEIERYIEMPQFVGVKFHPSYAGISIDSEATRKLVAGFAHRKAPFLIHTWGPGEPTKVMKLAKEFPEQPFIMGHGGADAWKEAADVINNTANTYTEFCNSNVEPGRIRKTIDRVGFKRVLFGTDSGLFDPAFDIGFYEEAELTPMEQAAILYDNAAALFGLDLI